MGDTIAQTIQELPIPEDVREWDANITRPSVISKPYDIRIPKESIFYIPSTQKYVVSMNCDLCKYQQQRCDRTRPTCKRCKKTGVDCKISNKGYQELPPLKINKGYQELPPLKINKGKRKRAAGEVQSKNKSKRVKVAEATDSESYDEKSITVTRRRQKHFTEKRWNSTHKTACVTTLFDLRDADYDPAKRKSSGTAPAKTITTISQTIPLPPIHAVLQKQRLMPNEGTPELSSIAAPKKQYRREIDSSDRGLEAKELSIGSQKPKRGRRVVGASYTVCVPEQKVNPFTTYVTPPNMDSICVQDAITPKPNPEVPWALDKAELLAAIPSYPHIFEDKNIGHRGGIIDYLIFEASSWPEDSWEGPTMCITRKWTQPESSLLLRGRGRKRRLLLPENVPSQHQSPDLVQSHSTSVLLWVNGGTVQPEIGDMQGTIDTTGETPPSFMNTTLDIGDPSTSVLQTPFANAYSKSLPAEAECFYNNYTQKEPIRVIAGRDWSLWPFLLPQQYGFTALGLFTVAEFTVTLDRYGEHETVVFRIKLEWVRNPCSPKSHVSSTEPWWLSYIPRNDVTLKDITINCKETPHMDFFPGIPYDETSTVDNGQYDTSCYDFAGNEWPSAWLCSHCGKVCPVIPFRYSVSWTCGSCNWAPQSKAKASFNHAAYGDPYDLRVALPIQHEDITHTVSWGRDSDRYVLYRFGSCGIDLEHVSQEDQDYIMTISSLFEELQISVDFQPSGSYKHVFVYEANCSSVLPKPIQRLWNVMLYYRGSRLNTPRWLRCFAWVSKGTTKNIVIGQGIHSFLSLGTTMTLKFNIHTSPGEARPQNFEMPHGSSILAVNTGSDLSFSVQTAGPSILVVAQLEI